MVLFFILTTLDVYGRLQFLTAASTSNFHSTPFTWRTASNASVIMWRFWISLDQDKFHWESTAAARYQARSFQANRRWRLFFTLIMGIAFQVSRRRIRQFSLEQVRSVGSFSFYVSLTGGKKNDWFTYSIVVTRNFFKFHFFRGREGGSNQTLILFR